METMRAIVLVTCVISILSGLLDVLKPSAKFDRQLRLLLASVFVLGIFTPLSRGAAEFQPNWDCVAELTENSLAGTAAVSYTHLDVYKRQWQPRSTAFCS